MPRIVRAVVAAGVLAAAAALATAALAAVTPAQLQVMVLPQSAFGARAAGLPVDSDSGFDPNAKSGSSSPDPAITAAYLTKIGRVTGYQLEFTSPSALAAKSGLVSAASEVELFRSASGASALLHRVPADLQRLSGKRQANALSIGAVGLFSPGRVGDEARGLRVEVLAGGVHVWVTTVAVRLGTLLATVTLGRGDAASENAAASSLARALARRVDDVRAGRIHPRPTPLPSSAHQKLGGLGPPAGGPDLAAIALSPRDLDSGGRLEKQAYVRNPDDVAEYQRDLGPGRFRGTQLLALSSDVELQPGATDGRGYFLGLRTIFSGPRGHAFLEQAIRSYVQRSSQRASFAFEPVRDVSAGDGAFAVGARATYSGVKMRLVLAVVNVGPVVTLLTIVAPPGQPSPATLQSLLRVEAAHARAALH